MGELRDGALAARDEGFTFPTFLTAVDELGRDGGFRVVLVLERPEDRERRVVVEHLDRAAPETDRVDDLWPAAAWLQRQVHDLFGIRFRGADLDPLIHHGDGHPLRKEALLAPRRETPWPGALEPGSASPSGRRLLPVGVPDPTVAEDPDASPADVALSATGTRTRRRR
ncbi:NADH-quinone oxidoreductase subunit C [uncultured Tessaracoccus sp.]|uniref:NADH-quinone oxidoreductase subunit C n=1 Tax=uncultured Tessaracoccus sp. TaxID=905023 RepID=UPI0025E313CF|nr:NADH-quinone oxidoreductase subunit C [uncultured Tessaracoccus sp.]